MNIIIYLLQVTACTAVFYLFYFLFLSRLTFFTTNRWYLLTTVLLSFLIPWLRITISEQQPYVAAVQQLINVPQTVPLTAPTIVQQAPLAAGPIQWGVILRIGHWVIAAVLGVHLLLTLLAFFRRIKGKRLAKIGKVIVLSGQQQVVNGSFLNYIFLNDEALSRDEIQQVIAHEMLHIKLYHSADRILVKIAQIILWFNPFIYLYARSVEENHEFEVDREVARSTDKHNYANLLVHLSVAGQGMLYHNFSKVPLKKRISMLFNKPSNKMKTITYVLIVPVVLISCLAFARLKKSESGQKNWQNDQKADSVKNGLNNPVKSGRKTVQDLEAYQRTDDFKQKANMVREITGKLVTVKVKEKVTGEKALGFREGFIITYNNHEYMLSTLAGQTKNLNNLLKAGEEIQMKVFRAAIGKGYMVSVTPAYIIKGKVKIFQLLDKADKEVAASSAADKETSEEQSADLQKKRTSALASYDDPKTDTISVISSSQFYSRMHIQSRNNKNFDKVTFKLVNGAASANLHTGGKLGVFIDGVFYNEDEIKKLPVQKTAVLTFSDSAKAFNPHKIPNGGYAVPFSFKSKIQHNNIEKHSAMPHKTPQEQMSDLPRGNATEVVTSGTRTLPSLAPDTFFGIVTSKTITHQTEP